MFDVESQTLVNQTGRAQGSIGRRVLNKITESRQSLVFTAICVVLVVYIAVSAFGGWSTAPPVTKNGVFGKWANSIGHFDGMYSSNTQSFNMAIIADLDKQSKVPSDKKGKWRSIFKKGVLQKTGDNKFSVDWGEGVDIFSSHSEAGRGMELSELKFFGDQLLTFDDRSGMCFEITNENKVIPRLIMMEGDGTSDKGQKTEWATVKDDTLYVGSFGKEYVNTETDEIMNHNNLWVTVVDKNGVVHHEDWTQRYESIRKETNTVFPGYMIIEAVEWSDVHKRWFILPRRVSPEKYDEVKDEERGSNIIISASDDFSDVATWTVGELTNKRRGFSSFKFLPGSNDSIVVALKSEENESLQTQTTHVTVFELDVPGKSAKVLMGDVEIDGGVKFEGLAFMS